MEERRQLNDHDLLVRLDQKVDDVIEDIAELKSGTSGKITDHEVRIRRIETWGAIAIGFMYAIQAYLNFIKK